MNGLKVFWILFTETNKQDAGTMSYAQPLISCKKTRDEWLVVSIKSSNFATREIITNGDKWN